MITPSNQSPALAGAREESDNLSTPDINASALHRQRAQIQQPYMVNVPPPHSEQAERGALGCILLAADQVESQQIREMVPKLRSQDFHDLRLKEIYGRSSRFTRTASLHASSVRHGECAGRCHGIDVEWSRSRDLYSTVLSGLLNAWFTPLPAPKLHPPKINFTTGNCWSSFSVTSRPGWPPPGSPPPPIIN